MGDFRVRFAPSPTGALHIGGVRTALYNYLLARKHGGTFILRMEDTDQNRYVPGAEAYILASLEWLGLHPDEGPFRQSERKDIYRKYALELVERGHAYYAFDTTDELNTHRQQDQNFRYDASNRMDMNNSLRLSSEELRQRLDAGTPYTLRLKVPPNETVVVNDLIRNEVAFDTNELDDKVILKEDGMPTYHLANIVDDHLMRISHVVRGEEWLPSTAHHVLLYRFLGWEDSMPQFAHLPLILKPNGKGKLSKRDGTRLGIPVFPISWEGEGAEDSFSGFREFGFLPAAVINFLAFLGWNPGTEQEIFSLDELCEAFSTDRISRSGARFDYDKARWYNQQYIQSTPPAELAAMIRPIIESHGHQPTDAFLQDFAQLFRDRASLLPDFWEQGYYFFEPLREYDEKTIRKKWSSVSRQHLEGLCASLQVLEDFHSSSIEGAVKAFLEQKELGFGAVFPLLRVALSGSLKGPGVFEMMALMGKETVLNRLRDAMEYFDRLLNA